jgi:SHS2 domain-containing protein
VRQRRRRLGGVRGRAELLASVIPQRPRPLDVASSEGFEYFEHTADVGLRAWAPTLAGAFEQAARALVAQMIEPSRAASVGEARLEVEADSDERLLLAFLDEVLFAVQTRGLVVADVEVSLARGRLVATLRGEAYDAARHGHLHEVKAITRHGLVVERGPPARVEVILDI